MVTKARFNRLITKAATMIVKKPAFKAEEVLRKLAKGNEKVAKTIWVISNWDTTTSIK